MAYCLAFYTLSPVESFEDFLRRDGLALGILSPCQLPPVLQFALELRIKHKDEVIRLARGKLL